MKSLGLFLLFILSLYAQKRFNPSSEAGKGLNINTSNEFNGDLKKKILKVNLSIPYDFLSFVKYDSEHFSSVVDFSVYVYHESGELAYKSFSSDTVKLLKYKDTNSSNDKAVSIYRFPLESGNYEVTAIASMRYADRKYRRTKLIKFDDSYQNKVFLSDLKVFNESQGIKQEVTSKLLPRDSGYLGFKFNSSNLDVLRNLNFLIRIKDDRDKPIYKNLFLTNENVINQEHSFRVKKNKFLTNAFKLEILARYETDVVDSLVEYFTFQWSAIPKTKDNMVFALTRMKYIIATDSLNRYIDSELEKSQQYFKRFWMGVSAHGTLDDGLKIMAEYFRRVAYANQNFSSYSKANGWLKDMGRIYIKFGPPDDVIRRNVNSPNYRSVIVWTYYRERKSFFFYDKTGFNNFTLTPESLDTEYQF